MTIIFSGMALRLSPLFGPAETRSARTGEGGNPGRSNHLAISRNIRHMLVQRSMADFTAATTGSVIFPPEAP
jgi:hypothetical protein